MFKNFYIIAQFYYAKGGGILRFKNNDKWIKNNIILRK